MDSINNSGLCFIELWEVFEAQPNVPVTIVHGGDNKTEATEYTITIEEPTVPTTVKVASMFNITGNP